MNTIIEPFKIKVVEPIRITTRAHRVAALEKAGYNPFRIPSVDVLIDLLTDSGTAAMSSAQWAGIMVGDEAYACSTSFNAFEHSVRSIFGFKQILPTHQGRAAERILTTRANVEANRAEALNLTIPEAAHPAIEHPFKGNMDLGRLEDLVRKVGPAKIGGYEIVDQPAVLRHFTARFRPLGSSAPGS